MDVAALVARYEAVTQQEEVELLKRLIENGWEAGCWLRPNAGQLLTATQEEITEFLEALRGRPGFARDAAEDPFPNGRPQEPIEGREPCYIILSQRCDIVGVLKNEPLVELAPAVLCTDKGRIKNAWRNSPRDFPIDPRVDETFVVDLRYRYFITKLDLASLTPQQALPADEPEYKIRERFVLRTGQRYTRAAVPDKLMERVVEHLAKIVQGDDEANEIFTEWALFHGGQREKKPGLVATYQLNIDETLDEDEKARLEDEIRQTAEDKFEAVIAALPNEAKAELELDDAHRTQAISETDLTVAKWRLSWKLEWDAESFRGNPDAATPAR
jgi:hypothetical protein